MNIQATQIASPLSFKKGVILCAVLLITFVAFLPSLRNDFTNWDDEAHYLENPDVLAVDRAHVSRIFTRMVNKTYIPLTILSFAAERQFFGHDAYIFHRDNLLLHMGVVALIFIFALKLGIGVYGAGLAALLFGIHPMHVESVAWVTERKDVLYALFYMLALNSYLRYVDTSHRKAYWFSIIYGILSVLAKPMALSLPLILFLIDWMKKRTISRKLFLEKIPYFLSIIPIAAVTYFMNARTIHNELQKAFLIWNWSLTFYIRKFFVPFNFYPLYNLPRPVSPLNPPYGLSLFLAILLVICIIRLKRDRWFIFACLYYFFSIFFLLRYDHVKDISIVADRFMYLPSLGFCLYLGVVLDRVRSWPFMTRPRRAALITVIGLGVALLAQRTFVQCKVWKDGVTLWTRVIDHNPVPLAFFCRARAYEYKKQYDLALDDYNRAIRIKDNFAKAYANRGNVYMHKGQFDLALADFNRTIEFSPALAYVYNNRGNIYYDRGKFDLALADFNHAIEFNPRMAEAYNNRGNLFYDQGKYELALVDFKAALENNPELVEAYSNRGSVLAILGQYDLALADFSAALEKDPKSIEALSNRGSMLAVLGKYDPALECFNRALAMDPDNYATYAERGIMYFLQGQDTLALSDFNMAIRMNPKFTQAFDSRGKLYARQERWDLALADYTSALNLNPQLVETYYRRSVVYMSMGKYPEAIRDAQKAAYLGYPNTQSLLQKIFRLQIQQ